jgi:hypothetical protein
MIVYSKFNNNRKKIYQLITQIEKCDNEIFSTKNASSYDSKPFLNSFFEKYNLLQKNNFSFVPVKPLKINDTQIRFDYVEVQTLESILFEALLEKDKDKFIKQIKQYFALVKKNHLEILPLSKKFLSIFSLSQQENNFKEKSIACGCIDLNFNNIFFDSLTNKYSLIDYEWTFNFPIPYKYICFRTLLYFYTNFYDNRPNNFIPIQFFLDFLKITPEMENKYLNFEYNFQIYVCGNNFKKIISHENYINNYFLSKEATNHSCLFENLVESKI